MKNPAVYILASKRNGTLYIGVTSDLIKRVWQHREGLADGFTKQYLVKMLVWYEQHETMESAISKEKTMKKWLRKWKLTTIENMNPNWLDLWPQINVESPMPTHHSLIPDTPFITDATVIPANAGIQNDGHERLPNLDSRIRGNDEVEE